MNVHPQVDETVVVLSRGGDRHEVAAGADGGEDNLDAVVLISCVQQVSLARGRPARFLLSVSTSVQRHISRSSGVKMR